MIELLSNLGEVNSSKFNKFLFLFLDIIGLVDSDKGIFKSMLSCQAVILNILSTLLKGIEGLEELFSEIVGEVNVTKVLSNI